MKKLLITLFVTTALSSLIAQVERERDVIYQKSEGVALTMDVYKPVNPNGAAIVKIVSGGWKSSHSRLNEQFAKPYIDHGYTVFAVVHGSQPRYKVRDIMDFMHRSVRFIRVNSDRWGIDPQKIGVTGSSAGGHLSLILATKGGFGDPNAKDPVDRASSAVQAAAVFYPPTDYLNWAEFGDIAVGVGKQERWKPAFGPESDTAEGRAVLGRAMSSIYHIGKDTPPVLIVHGDADEVVPLFQSKSFQEVAHEKGVVTEIVIKPGAGHGWKDKIADEQQFVTWFDRYLLGVSPPVDTIVKEEIIPAKPPRPLHQEAPVYPQELREAGTAGTVVLEVVVKSDGSVGETSVLESDHPAFSTAAVEAVSKWRFQPGERNGKPVDTRIKIPIPFKFKKAVQRPDILTRPPQLVSRPAPVFPRKLRDAGVEGTVVLDIVIKSDGSTGNISVVSSDDPAFTEAAEQAVSRWRFNPGLQDGKPVDTRVRVPIPFKIRD